MDDPLEQIGKLLDAEFGPDSYKRLGSALAIYMPTEKYRDRGGNAYCTTLIMPKSGHLLLTCPELLDISDCEYRSELLAACLSLQNLSYSTVQFQLLQDRAGRKLPDAHHTCYIELRLPAFEEAGLADVLDESLKLTDLLLLCGMLAYEKVDQGKEIVGQYKKALPWSIEDTEWLRVVLLELKLLGSVYTALAEQGKAPSSDEIHVL
jgi:hypothetical protein